MNRPQQYRTHYKNRILAGLPAEEIGRLAPHLVPVTLKLNQTLSDGRPRHGYFVEEGMASAVVTLQNGDTVEVGVIGHDGMVGLPIVLGTGSMPGRTFMRIGGTGYRIDPQFLKEAFDGGGVFRQSLQNYLQAFMVLASQSAACNRRHPVVRRLARWLMTCRDRMETDQLPLTQEFLAQMLGTPRTTVTLAARMLGEAGLIEYSRGRVHILNRSGLEKRACECYRTVRNEYRRLGLL